MSFVVCALSPLAKKAPRACSACCCCCCCHQRHKRQARIHGRKHCTERTHRAGQCVHTLHCCFITHSLLKNQKSEQGTKDMVVTGNWLSACFPVPALAYSAFFTNLSFKRAGSPPLRRDHPPAVGPHLSDKNYLQQRQLHPRSHHTTPPLYAQQQGGATNEHHHWVVTLLARLRG